MELVPPREQRSRDDNRACLRTPAGSDDEGAVATATSDVVLTLEEFASLLKIGRSTVFEWIQKRILVPGKHFLKIEKTIRFRWPQALEELMADCASGEAAPLEEAPAERSPTPPSTPATRRSRSTGGRRGPVMDLEY
jgi:predicted DNA-binding transcriptional regulator AlpA